MDTEVRDDLIVMFIVILTMFNSAAGPTIIDEMTVVTIAATIALRETTAETIVITVRIAAIVATARALLTLAAPITTTVALPGLHPGGIMRNEGLGLMTDGTMIDEGAMMTEESLILIMTAAGTMTDHAGTTAGGMKRTTVTTIDLQDTPTEIVVGHARFSQSKCRGLDTMVESHIGPWQRVRLGQSYFRDHAPVSSS